jgi:DNA-binding NarL/FixJ family response regulator
VKEIAKALNVSAKTVEFHKPALMERLNIHTTAELTQYAIGHGMVVM